MNKLKLKLLLVNDTLTVIFPSGEILCRSEADKQLYNTILETETEEEVRNLMIPELFNLSEKAKEEVQKDIDFAKVEEGRYQILLDWNHFEQKGEVIYMKGINVPVPEVLLIKFTEYAEGILNLKSGSLEEYEALKNFWKWLSLCPNPESRRDTFKFLQNHDLRINKNGMFFAYRRVVNVKSQTTDKELISFVSNQYLKLRKQKKGTGNYNVIKENNIYILQDKVDSIILGVIIGNLKELYLKLPEMQKEKIFTDNHTKTFDIRIGREVKMDAKDADWSNQNPCSRGLHIFRKGWNAKGFGDTTLLVCINPANIVSIPVYDCGKMRVSAYYPVAVLDKEEEGKYLEDADVLDLADEYMKEQVEHLEEMVSRNNAYELGINRRIGEMDQGSLNNIVKDLKSMKDVISKRVNKVS